MEISDQIIGVIIGGSIALITAIITNFVDLLREERRANQELKKISHQEQVKFQIAQKSKAYEEKSHYVSIARQFSNSEEKSSFNGIDLSGTILSGLDLRGIELRGANLTNSKLRYTCLAHADLEGAILTGADLEGSDLQNTNLRNAELSGAILRNANMLGTKIDDVNLSSAIV